MIRVEDYHKAYGQSVAVEGLSFEVLAPQQVEAVFDQLQAISDAWLSDHNTAEKAFSLGAFRRDRSPERR